MLSWMFQVTWLFLTNQSELRYTKIYSWHLLLLRCYCIKCSDPVLSPCRYLDATTWLTWELLDAKACLWHLLLLWYIKWSGTLWMKLSKPINMLAWGAITTWPTWMVIWSTESCETLARYFFITSWSSSSPSSSLELLNFLKWQNGPILFFWPNYFLLLPNLNFITAKS